MLIPVLYMGSLSVISVGIVSEKLFCVLLSYLLFFSYDHTLPVTVSFNISECDICRGQLRYPQDIPKHSFTIHITIRCTG